MLQAGTWLEGVRVNVWCEVLKRKESEIIAIE